MAPRRKLPEYAWTAHSARPAAKRVRTLGEMPFEVALLEAEERPVYQRIAEEALQLQRLGMNNARIGRRLKVDPKTVEKALEWWRRNDNRHSD